jgi:hypothetical protein
VTSIHPPDSIFDPRLFSLVQDGLERIRRELAQFAPSNAGALEEWMRRQSPTAAAEDTFRDLRAYFLLIPWMLEIRINGSVDLEFQRLLVYSSMNGYYYSRLLDDAGDGHVEGVDRLLPLSTVFHTNFHKPYTAWFDNRSPFWEFFERNWIGMADATSRGFSMRDYEAADFSAVTVQKVAAVYIPAAAVCYRYHAEQFLDPWLGFYRRFTHFQEMLDDFCDWHEDLAAGRPSYLLCEAARRRRSGESVEACLMREGLAWGYSELIMFHEMARAAAADLNSPLLEAYLEHRLEQVESYWTPVLGALAPLNHLAAVLEGGSRGG